MLPSSLMDGWREMKREGERGGRLGTAAQTAGNTVRSICPSFGFTLRSKFHQLAEVTLHAHAHTNLPQTSVSIVSVLVSQIKRKRAERHLVSSSGFA